MKATFLIFFAILLSVQSCKTCCKPFKIERTTHVEPSFRTDGFYYYTYEDGGKHFTPFLVFCNNGVVFGGIHAVGDSNDVYNKLNDSTFLANNKRLAFSWGIYNVHDNQLIYEKWTGGNWGGRYGTLQFNAEILNDTTLRFEQEQYGIMYFYPLTEKPDSTNPFIK